MNLLLVFSVIVFHRPVFNLQQVDSEAARTNRSAPLHLRLLDHSDIDFDEAGAGVEVVNHAEDNEAVEVIDHAEDNEAAEVVSASQMPAIASVAKPSISADKVDSDAAKTDEKDSVHGGLPGADPAASSNAPVAENDADVPANMVDQMKTTLEMLCEESNQSKEVVAHALIITNGVVEDAKNYLIGDHNGSCNVPYH